MNPIPRDYRFHGAVEAAGDWSAHGSHFSQWFNALSLLFPDGERFFIHSVRHYADRRELPQELRSQIDRFVQQEAFHAREHARHNKLQDHSNRVAGETTTAFHRFIERLQLRLSSPVKLGLTIAAEHWTAALADVFLRFPELADTRPGAEPIGRMLLWHAVEESEHKAVAYDVYERVIGKGVKAYALRMATMVTTSLFLWGVQSVIFLQLVREAGLLWDVRGWVQLSRTLFVAPAFLPRLFPLLVDYVRPNFHPWQHDNRQVLAGTIVTMASWDEHVTAKTV